MRGFLPLLMVCVAGCNNGERPANVDAGTPPEGGAADSTWPSDWAGSDLAVDPATPDVGSVPDLHRPADQALSPESSPPPDSSPPADLGDPLCVGVACVSPPSKTCVNYNTLRTYSSAGSCQGGTCSYPSTDTKCSVACVGDKCSPCGPGFTQWPCYPPATVSFTCCVNGKRTCSNGKGCTCYDACY